MVEGPGRQVVPVCGLAGALALLTCAAGVVIGLRPDLPNVTAMSSSLAVIAVADAGERLWLGQWSEEPSNVAIAAIAGLSLAVRMASTLVDALESTDRKYWNSRCSRGSTM
jgi:hypothetical protein